MEAFKHSTDKMFKKAQSGGLITGLVFGVASLIIGVIIAFVITQTLINANLLSAGTTNDTAVEMQGNFSEGVDNIASKIPTVLLVAAIVLILGVLVLLVGAWQRMRMGGGGGI